MNERNSQDTKVPKTKKVSLTKESNDAIKAQVVTLKFLGANPELEIRGTKQEQGKANYFIGKEPSHWHTNIPTFSEITYKDIYKGIDFVFKGISEKLKYEFIVNPGADPKTIKLAYDNVDSLAVSDTGGLIIKTSLGELRGEKLHIYQVIDGKKVEVEGGFESKNYRYGFNVGTYNHLQPLIIDPDLIYSTYLGGGGEDIGRRIAVDNSGNAYVTGYTASTFPTTPAPYQSSNAGGAYDAFVTKFDASGALVYSTYLGGGGEERGHGIAVDHNGNAYVTGYTTSTNFPTTANAYQSVKAGYYLAFVTKLNASGNDLIYSTYLGFAQK